MILPIESVLLLVDNLDDSNAPVGSNPQQTSRGLAFRLHVPPACVHYSLRCYFFNTQIAGYKNVAGYGL